MRNFEKITNIILVIVLALIVFFQGIQIKDLQKRTDYLFDELYVTTGVMHIIERDLECHIEKEGAE